MTLEPFPTWTALDQDYPNLVVSWTADRGRQYELDRTDGGRATVQIADTDGILDPTNTTGPYYGKLQPLLQAVLCRRNPVDSTWNQRFRGFISDYDYSFDPSQKVNFLTIELVDIFEILSNIEMLPNGTFGDDPTTDAPDSVDQVWFAETDFKTRIVQALTNAGIPVEFYVCFSGNVDLYDAVYSPGSSPMEVVQEAADGEFPGLGNVFPDRFGRLAAHGRLAKFDPGGTAVSSVYDAWSSGTTYAAGDLVLSGGNSYECILGHTNHVPPNVTYWEPVPDAWDWHHWHAGDGTAVAAASSTTAQIRTFAFNNGLSKIINSAYATPKRDGVALTAVEADAQVVTDPSSIAQYGIRSWSATELLTKEGLLDSATDLAETKKFATYYVDNYAIPQIRITEISFRSMRADRVGATRNWLLLSKVDIGDQVDVTISSPGGGGLVGGLADLPFFVEGIHESSEPLNGDFDNDTVSLDLSPASLFASNPFPTS